MRIKEFLLNCGYENEEKLSMQGALIFDDETCIAEFHYQDCCENVYADWRAVQNDKVAMNHEFTHIKIEHAKGGFRFGDDNIMVYVPCYNEQNGYYNSDLEIGVGHLVKRVTRDGTIKFLKFDIKKPFEVDVINEIY